VIRDATLDDAPSASELLALVNPEFIMTPESARHFMASMPPEAERRWWCDERGGAIVGWAHGGRVTDTSEPDVAWLNLVVHPNFRASGIGSALGDLVEEHVRSIGARRLLAWSRADDATVSFLRSRGFEQTGSSDVLVLDPRTVTAPETPREVELRPFSDYEDDPSPVYQVDVVSMLDEPGDITYDDVPYDTWLERFWNQPVLDRDVSMVALVDGRPATITNLQTDRRRGRATNNGTGTLPELRGRGLATLAKRASLARAAGVGITAVYTGNDTTNAPMQAINRRLGYRPCGRMLNWRKELARSTSAA
jgi:GNAT superfamily N-acetyltransferase